ncbi:MAG TPA: hypothetical protein VL137_08610 [Polyangiaceae bacterium]|nr:hypothetical protein [Polyangiaceae bacterium]
MFSHLRSRLPLLLGALLVALLCALTRPVSSANNRDGLAALLARATGQWVDSTQLVWEPSDGVLMDLLLGRRLFFLAAGQRGGPNDVYQASVRLAPSGQPLGARLIRNITQTPLGDEGNLHGAGRFVVFTTTAYDVVQALSVLDARGTDPGDLPTGFFNRVLAAVTAFQQTGHFAGLGHADIVFEQPPATLHLDLDDSRMVIDSQSDRSVLVFDLLRRTLHGLHGEAPEGGQLSVRQYGAKPFLLWAVDTLREELGPKLVAFIQSTVFGAKDRVERTAYSIANKVSASGSSELASAPKRARDTSEAATWPPAPIASLWSQPQAGEGQWVPAGPAPARSEHPPAFYRTFLRPDRNRPYAQLILIAMDMRQLQLGMQAGYEDPKPLTGPPGSGRLPKEAVGKVVAVFNGAFKTSHGAYGMMADGRVLVPAVPHAASIVIAQSGDVGFGNWPAFKEIPRGVIAFRQNLDALVEGRTVNPTGRGEWGERLAGDSVLSERTALCRTSAGQLYYAWGKELTADTLASALQQAGCDYAVHLDMNPKQCGFAFVSNDATSAPSKLELADERMDINPERYVTYSPKDFFFLVPYQATPAPLGGVQWQQSPGAQPEPTWMPALFEASAQLGSLPVQLTWFERGRVDWRLRAGLQEPRVQGYRPPKFELDAGDREAALYVTNLGNATAGNSYGMAFDGEPSLPLHDEQVTLVVPQSGDLRLVPPGQALELSSTDSAVQLPLLAMAGKISVRASTRGSRVPRAALCVRRDGTVIVASAENDSSDVLALALRAQGCDDVAELDRGSHHVAFSARAGTNSEIATSYEASALFAIGRPMQPHTFRFMPRSPTNP